MDKTLKYIQLIRVTYDLSVEWVIEKLMFLFLGTMCIREYGLVLAQLQSVFGAVRNQTNTRLLNASRSMPVA